MGTFLSIHPQNPQPRLIAQAAKVVERGGVIAYPTDSCYALGTSIANKAGLERIRRIRGIDEGHPFALLLQDLSEMATYATFSTPVYRLLKANTPGPYAFLLPATREVPRRLQDAKRKTIGVRIPDHPVAQALLQALGGPIMTASLILAGEQEALTDPEVIRDRLEHALDLIIDGGICSSEPTTVVDLTGDVPQVTRVGKGDPAPFL